MMMMMIVRVMLMKMMVAMMRVSWDLAIARADSLQCFQLGTHVNHAAACEHDDDVNDDDDEDDVNQGEDKDDFNYANCDEHNGENDNLKEVGDNHG